MPNQSANAILPSLSEEKLKMPPVAKDPLPLNEFSSNDSLYPQSVSQSLPRVNTWTLLSDDTVKYKTLEEMTMMKEQLGLEMRLESALHSAKENILHTDILLPDDLLGRIAQDIFTMSECEPCGLNGSVIFINLENRTKCRKLCKLRLNGQVVPTFELHLLLKEDGQKWFNPKKIISVLEKYFTSKRNPVLLSDSYQVEKKKLYRTGSEKGKSS
ncbi:DNA damage-inducible transcript 4-like protein [Lineus longissimus]|uniref:DNA damage-inducible transcript 4-like protein n=1 Tax=Lineus longissimus TaxID=88925 RepID=UPI002B4E46D1